MANENVKENVEVQENAHPRTPEEIALRSKIAKEMAEKVAQGKAVWQTNPEHRNKMHMPVNPRTGNYFRSGTAVVLMQKQFELGQADNRWISVKGLNAMKYHYQKENKGQELEIFPQKGTKAISIISGGKEAKYFNYSELTGKDMAKLDAKYPMQKYDAVKDAYGEKMLDYLDFKSSDRAAEKGKAVVPLTSENFWRMSNWAYQSVEKDAARTAEYRNSVAAEISPYLPAFEKRLDAIKAVDVSKQAKSPEEFFMASMAKRLHERTSDRYYVDFAARMAKLHGTPDAKIAKMIDNLAPESAKDPLRDKKGQQKFSSVVLDRLAKDKNLQKQIDDQSKKSAAR